MITLHASALVSALVYGDGRGRKARAALGRDTEWAVPEAWKIEVFGALRALTLQGHLTESAAVRAVDRLRRFGVDQVPLDQLLPRMWQLRMAFSGADAAYVALAEARGITLVTADATLARAAIGYSRVELIA